jgi:mRNA-degrading endonuclease toxin of MazEF toxin-antitoxin module
MRQWDIFWFPFPEGDHPAVILSPDEQCRNPDVQDVNILFASSARAVTRLPKPTEVMLDQSDGLDWKTVVRCHKIQLVAKASLTQQRGRVSAERQREICRKIAEVFRFRL